MSTRRSLERRRLAAEQDILKGASNADIHYGYGVSRVTASRWIHRVRAGKSMAATVATGRPANVRRDILSEFLQSHPECTGKQLQRLVLDHFGVLYHYDHLTRLRKLVRLERKAS